MKHKKRVACNEQFLLNLLIADEKIQIVVDDASLYKKLSKYFHKTKNYSKPTYVIEMKKIQQEIQNIKIKNNYMIIFNYSDNYVLINLLFTMRLLLQYLLIPAKIIFLHASSFVANNKAYIFCGSSGVGKSTIIKKVPQDSVLSDDFAILKKIGRTFFVYPTIFDQVKGFEIRNNKTVLDRIFLLKKATYSKIIPGQIDESLKKLFSSTVIYQRITHIADIKSKGLFPINNKNKSYDIKDKNQIIRKLKSFYKSLFDLTFYSRPVKLYAVKQIDIMKVIEKL